jgi:hypothetical protein
MSAGVNQQYKQGMAQQTAGNLPLPPANNPAGTPNVGAVANLPPQTGGGDPLPPPPTAMSPAPGPYSPFGNNPQQVTPPNLQDFMNKGVGAWSGINPAEKNFYGGQQIAGADPSQADYASVQGYADQAYQQARRNLDPIQQQQSRRMEQDLINKGIDPTSAQGKGMLDQMQRQQADQNAAASFGALQFGQGIQNQMAQQEQQKAQLAGQMQQGLWNQQLGASGQGLQYALGQMQNQLGLAGLQNQQYGMNLQNQLGLGQLDLARQGQDFGQMMGLEGLQFRNRQYGDQQQQYQDQLTMALLGMTPIPGVTPIDPSGAFGDTLASAGQNQGLLGRFIGF